MDNVPVFKFETVRLGFDESYGQYLYKNTTSNELISSWNEPKKGTNFEYKGQDIGLNIDASIIYCKTK